MKKKKIKLNNLMQLTSKQIEDYFQKEWKKFKKDLEKVYRDGLIDLGIPKDAAKSYAKKWMDYSSKKLRKKSLKRQKKYFKGEAFVRSHPMRDHN